ncbi:kinase-like protein, partial [Pleomassaria siparia CBS 279.74]
SSSASEGEVVEQLKANTLSHSRESTKLTAPDRVFGLDGASDHYGHNYRARSRSPSPYRRKATRSPSPYRRTRDRSPSPYRHGRGNRGGGHDSRASYNKRKASPPPRPGRPDKRYHADSSRHDERKPNDTRVGSRQSGAQGNRANTGDERYPPPISYVDNDHPIPVPGFNGVLQGRSNGRQQNENGHRVSPHGLNSTKQGKDMKHADTAGGQSNDVEMTNADDELDYTTTVAVEDKAPSEESREEKKRKWAAKRAEIAAQQAAGTPNAALLRQQAIINNASESTTTSIASPAAQVENTNSPPADSPRFSDMDSAPGSPDVMIVDKQDVISEGNSPSAANYDPTEDMLEDRARALRKAQQSDLPSAAYNEAGLNLQPSLPTVEKPSSKDTKKKDFDMFAFDDDDEEEENGEEEQETDTAKGTVLDAKLLDNWDDPDGYYKIISNELVNAGQYRMVKILGRGVFANVAQAEDVKEQNSEKKGKLVAIKIVRRNDLMRKASQKEMDFLRKLNETDPQDKRHIIRLLGSFDHKGHLCIVFEHMAKNLRDLLKEDTNGHGLSLQAVKMYARQMFSGLQHLRDCQIIHLDLKPDNILVSHDKKSVKLCDLGTAADKRDVIDRTEYLVSRFYRAPEIVLDMEYGHAIDMWAIGCTIYELWTGKILFTGRSNNQMIKVFLECLGWPSEKLLRKGQPASVLSNFELGPPLKFISREVDSQGNLSVRKIEQQKKITRDLKTRVLDAARGITEGGPSVTELTDFADLLGATLNWNVEKRIQPKEALAHKLFASKTLMPRPAVVKPPMVKRGS